MSTTSRATTSQWCRVQRVEGAREPEARGRDADCIQELMDAIDSYIPEPERDVDKPFLMPVEDVFSITGRGTVATGRIERGIVKQGEEVAIVGMGRRPHDGSDGSGDVPQAAGRGPSGRQRGPVAAGCGQGRDRAWPGVWQRRGSIKPHTKFKAEVYVLTKEEGGRHTPFFNGYRPQFYFRTTDVTGAAHLPEGVEMVMPGDNVQMEVELITPIAMDPQLRFAIREGGRTVGSRRRHRDHRVTRVVGSLFEGGAPRESTSGLGR